MEQNQKKSDRTIIKCTACGYKYYEGNVHKCQLVSQPVSVVEERELRNAKDSSRGEEKTEEKKGTIKTKKESFKMWK